MKTIINAAFFCFGAILPAFMNAQNSSRGYKADSLKVILIAQELLNAAGSGDSIAYKKYLHEDYLLMAEDGNLKTKKDLLAQLAPLPKGYEGSLKVTRPVVKKHNDIYILNFIADEYLKLYGQTLHTSYAETDTYRKTGVNWQLLASEVFELPKDPVVQMVNIDKLKLYTGIYQLDATVQYKVTIEDGALIGQRTGRDKMQLIPETETVFFVSGQRGRKIFISDETGQVIKMLERRSGVDLTWTKVL